MPRTWALQRTVPPAVEPVSLIEAKEQLRLTPSDICQDAALTQYITSAREQFEELTDSAVMAQTWIYERATMATAIQLHKPPLSGVSTLKYIDKDHNEQTIDPTAYDVNTNAYPGLLYIFDVATINPSDIATDIYFPWQITYTCGYALPTDVPRTIKQAICLLAAYYYETRMTASDMKIADHPHAFNSVVQQYTVYAP